MKNGVAKLLGCVFAGCMTLCVLAGVLGAHGAGSGNDPLITYSYVQKVLFQTLKTEISQKTGNLFSDRNRSSELDSHGKSAIGSMDTDWSPDAVADELVSYVTMLSVPSVTEQRKLDIEAGKSLIASKGATVTVLSGKVNAVAEDSGSVILVRNSTEYGGEKSLAPGDYVVVTEKGRVFFEASENSTVMVTGRIKLYSESVTMSRIFGSDRYVTAFKVANELKAVMGVDKFENIVVASGLNFADALSGSYLANQKNAPILLVSNNNINDVKDYIRANLVSGGTVYILGGPNSVSVNMETDLSGFNVKRLAGADRYATNMEILKEVGVLGNDILVCTGLNFADSLSASALNRPILLVNNNSLTETQKAFLARNSGKNIYIIGGPNSINENIKNELGAYGSVTRIYGATRYETSANLAKTFYPNAKRVVIAYGGNFPDGLGGGCLAYRLSAPLILAANGSETPAEAYVVMNNVKTGVAVGGSGMLPDAAVCKIMGAPKGSVVTVK